MNIVERAWRRIGKELLGNTTVEIAAAYPSQLTLGLMRRVNGILMSTAEVQAITETVRAVPHCRLLVFGVGNDSRHWVSSNRDGITMFAEHDTAWAAKIAASIGWSRIVEVRYSYRRHEWFSLLQFPDRLSLHLPAELSVVPWDVILVDGPTGMSPDQHGRMQSIFTAAELVRPGGHIFVHDCDREVERVYCDHFLGREHLQREIGILRHYRKAVRDAQDTTSVRVSLPRSTPLA